MKGIFPGLKSLWNKSSTSDATELINFMSVLAFAVVWLIALLTFSTTFSENHSYWITFSKILVVSSAAYFTGGLTGFIFGIPKTLQNPDRTNNNAANQPQSGIQGLFITNTSLEQISDWLTKIIVGVGLVSLKSIPDYLGNLQKSLQIIFPGKDISVSGYALALMIFSSIVGFMTLYIYTRVNLAAQFIKEAVDNSRLTDIVSKAPDITPEAKTNLLNQLK